MCLVYALCYGTRLRKANFNYQTNTAAEPMSKSGLVCTFRVEYLLSLGLISRYTPILALKEL